MIIDVESIHPAVTPGGYENPEYGDVADYIIKIPAIITPRIQETHIFIGHVIAEYVEYKMFGGKQPSLM